jgi:hypothetical protein
MREIRSSGSAEGVMSNHDPYSDLGSGSSGVEEKAVRIQGAGTPFPVCF